MKTISYLTAALFGLIFSSLTFAAKVNDPAPPIELQSFTTGQTVTLESLRGKVVLVDFWASWCIPCRKSLPMFNELRANIGTEKFEILAVNLDENLDDANAFLASYPVSYPVVWDQGQVTPGLYDVQGMPSSYIVDQNGVVRAAHKGFKEEDIVKYDQEIRALLGM
jgi:thiol-disulfide isomerase/thioredoxin